MALRNIRPISFSRSKSSKSSKASAEAPTTSTGTTCGTCGCLIHNRAAENRSTAALDSSSPLSASPLQESPIEPAKTPKSRLSRENLLAGAPVSLDILGATEVSLRIPELRNVAEATAWLVEMMKSNLQNVELLRRLLQHSISLGQSIVDAVTVSCKAGDSLPEYFEQQNEVVLDTLKEAKQLCHIKGKEWRETKHLNIDAALHNRVEVFLRRIQGNLEFFSVCSNIVMKPHFEKWLAVIDEYFPLNCYVPQSTSEAKPASSGTNIDNSRHKTIAPVVKNTITAYNGIVTNSGNQTVTVHGEETTVEVSDAQSIMFSQMAGWAPFMQAQMKLQPPTVLPAITA